MRALLPVLAGAWFVTASCHGRQVHIFGGYTYDATLNCLEAPGAIDVVAGADPGLCDHVLCWLAPDGSIIVTSEACDAPPDYVDETQNASSPCVKALAAYAGAGHTPCLAAADGGGGGGGGLL